MPVFATPTVWIALMNVVNSVAFATAVTATLNFIAITAASMAASKLLSPKAPSFSDSSLLDRNQTIRSPIAARTIVYGQCKTSGVLVYISTTGEKNEYLHMVIALAGHEVEEIGDVYFNDELVLTGSGSAASGKYAGYAEIYKKLGGDTQTVETNLEAATATLTDGKWTSAHRLRGIAYLYVQLKWNAEIFVGGIPNVSAVVKGKKVWDPRTSTVGYSANAALCLRDYLTDTRLGMAMDPSEIDDTSFITAANICDEQVQILPISPATYENRYEANGVVSTAETPDGNIGKLLSAMGGLIAYSGGKVVVYAGNYRIPAVTLNETHFVGALNVQTKTSARDRVNGVKGVYVSPDNNWQVTDFPPITSATYVTQDNGIKYWRDVTLPLTTSPSCAQRLSVMELRRARQEITMTARFRLEAMQVRAGDTVMISNSKLGWTQKIFEVIEWHFVSDGAPPQLAVEMTLRETDSGVYSWTVNDEIAVDTAPKTTLPDPFSLDAPTNLALTADGTTQLIQADGTALPRIKVAWSAPSEQFIQAGGAVVIEYKQGNSTTYLTWSRVEGDQVLDYISSDVRIGTSYDVRIFGESYFKVSTSYLTASITVAKDTIAPSAPTGLTVTAGNGLSLSLDWDDNTEPDFSEYGVYRNTTGVTPASSSADQIARARASRFVDAQVTIGTTYYYWVSAYDTVENVSGFSARASGIATSVSGTVTTAVPSTPDAFSLSTSPQSAYYAADGNLYSRFLVDLPAVPSGAANMNLLYKLNTDTRYMVAAVITAGNVAWPISDLAPGVTYDIALQAFSNFGYGSALRLVTGSPHRSSSTVTGPAIPTGLTITAANGIALSLDWDDNIDSGFSEYGVYRNTTGTTPSSVTVDQIAQTRSSRFVDTQVTVGTTYFYWVNAYNFVENTSGFSSRVSAMATSVSGTLTTTAPSTPDAFPLSTTPQTAYYAADGSIYSRFLVDLPPVPSGAVYMNLLYKVTGDPQYMVAAVVTVGSVAWPIVDVAPGVTYDIALQAVSNYGYTSALRLVTGSPHRSSTTVTAPNTPTGLSITAANGIALSLDWNDNTDLGFSEYGVYRNTTGVTPSSVTVDKIAETRSSRFVDTEVAVGTQYYYWVNAYNTVESASGFATRVSATAVAVTGTLDTTAPSTPSAPTYSSETTYTASDGSVSALIVINVPAMPTLGRVLSVLYRTSGAANWQVAAQLDAGGGTLAVDDLSPGIAYEFAAQAFSYYSIASAVSSTLSRTAPTKSSKPATLSGGLLQASGVVPKFYTNTTVYLFGCCVSWTASTETDISYYEVKATTDDDPASTNYSWTLYDNASFVVRTTIPRTIIYNVTNASGWVRVRAVNTSGIAGDWYKIGQANNYSNTGAGDSAWRNVGTSVNSVAAGDDTRIVNALQKGNNLSDLNSASTARTNLGLGTIATQAASNVAITGGTISGITSLKIGTGSSTSEVKARYSGYVDVTLSGGAVSEAFDINLTNRGFAAKPDMGVMSSIDPGYVVVYDRTSASSTSTNARCTIKSTDGSNIPATTTPIMFIFEDI